MRPQVEQSDLLVMISRHDAGPLVRLEAAIAGVPTIGTRVDHIADFAPDAAVAISVGNDMELAEQIAALAEDEERRLNFARAAQERTVSTPAQWTMQRICEFF
ncbi:glycosyltransferase [Altererythrobacter salegens]|uniref:Glycosyltransferase n=1 Tax=Croceibacterium salegens TaxID=1737568 RepID=A0A6I4SSJ4_9SPHN|nr:glycosyltransferase [Croceibacterium salegens]